MQRKVAGLKDTLHELDTQIDGQRARIAIASASLDRSNGLVSEHFISPQALEDKRAGLIEEHIRLGGLERDAQAAKRDLESAQQQLYSLPLRRDADIGQTRRALAELDQGLLESEAKRGQVLRAPEGGIVASLVADVGQTVDVDTPLLSVMPASTALQGQLYVPSRAVGFVKPGDVVTVRYQAFPYQKFGLAAARIVSISDAALSRDELAHMAVASPSLAQEPYYLVVVQLPSQAVMAYGRPQRLRAGMEIEADLIGESRRLYEWILEPVYTLGGGAARASP